MIFDVDPDTLDAHLKIEAVSNTVVVSCRGGGG